MSTVFYATVFVGGVVMLVWLYRGPFYVPTRRKHISRIIAMLSVKPGEKIVDLGSGDGRLLIALAEAGAIAYGFEHNPFLVWRSRFATRRLGLDGKVNVSRSNFWKEDVSSYNAAVIYGIPYIMERLEKKLRSELRPGARVVSYSFQFPTWKPEKSDRRVYLYRKE